MASIAVARFMTRCSAGGRRLKFFPIFLDFLRVAVFVSRFACTFLRLFVSRKSSIRLFPTNQLDEHKVCARTVHHVCSARMCANSFFGDTDFLTRGAA